MGQIYGECGSKDKFAYVNWDEVKNNLVNHGRAIANAKDEATGTSLHATILDNVPDHVSSALRMYGCSILVAHKNHHFDNSTCEAFSSNDKIRYSPIFFADGK
jgi:hypothetical protein